jgi:anti-sigma factor RsiW
MSRIDPSSEPMIARDATYYRAPDALRDRIRASLASDARSEPRPAPWRWAGMAAAFAAVAVLSWTAALVSTQGAADDAVARDIVAAHVRSLMAENHLNDVASSDQHTVKPWFTGKLDFAPRVTDFASSGFTLTGGRLDYVNGRAVAALTYRHRLHVVNVFEWPGRGPDMAPQSIGRQGYSLARWTRDGIEYWAISDTASPDLLLLAELIAKT